MDIQVGSELRPVVRKITQRHIDLYAEASEDFNRLHIDPAFAKNTPFKGTIAHGFIPVGYISKMMVNAFGKGWICGGEMSLKFLAPVRPEDIVTTGGKVIRLEDAQDKKRAVCEIYCENQAGRRVIVGEASALILQEGDQDG